MKFLLCFLLLGAGTKVPKGLEEYTELFTGTTVVSFGAEWCAACPLQKAQNAILTAKGHTVAYYDVDEHPDLYNHFKKTGALPHTVVMSDGKIKMEFEGVTSWRKMVKKRVRLKFDFKGFKFSFFKKMNKFKPKLDKKKMFQRSLGWNGPGPILKPNYSGMLVSPYWIRG